MSRSPAAGGVGDDGVGRAAVLAGQQTELVVAQLDGVAVCRVDVEVVEVVAQHGQHVVGLGGERRQARRRVGERGIEAFGLGQEPFGGAQGVEPAARRFVGQQGGRAADALDEPLGVTQALALDLEPLVFAGLDGGRLDLVDLKAQQVDFAVAVAALAAQGDELARERLQGRPGGAVVGQQGHDLGARPGVEQVELAVELQQAGVFELAVKGDPLAQRRLDGGQRRHEAVEEGPRTPLAGDAARHRQRLAVVVEDGLHERLLGARAHQALLALLAEQQADALGEQRLAGAGLAGDDVEPRRELEPGLGDEHEVGDRQFSEHGRGRRRASAQKTWRARLKSFSSTLW